MTSSGPLGRDSMAFTDKMLKYRGEMLRNADAAELLCPVTERDEIGIPNNPKNTCCSCCDFRDDIGDGWFECSLVFIRRWLSDRDQQHDPEPARPIGTCPELDADGIHCVQPLPSCNFQKFDGAPISTYARCIREEKALAVAEAAEESGRGK